MDGGVGGRRSEPASEQAGRGVTESGPARHRGHGGAGGPPGAAAAAWPLQAVADVSVGQDKDEMVFVFKNSRDLRPADTQSLCQKDRRRCAHGPRLHLCTKVCAASRGMSGTSTSSSLEEVTLPVSMLTRTKPSASCGASVRADVRSGARLRQHGAGLHTLRRRPCRGTLLHRRGPGPYPPHPQPPVEVQRGLRVEILTRCRACSPLPWCRHAGTTAGSRERTFQSPRESRLAKCWAWKGPGLGNHARLGFLHVGTAHL